MGEQEIPVILREEDLSTPSRIEFSGWARLRRQINKVLIAIWRVLYPVMLVIGCLYLILPSVVVILASISETSYVTFPPKGISLKWYGNFFTREGFIQSFMLSVVLALAVAVLAVAVSVILSVMVGRRARGIQSWAVTMAYLPLLLPTIVYGPALLIWMSHFNILDAFWSTMLTLGAAHLILALPFALQSIMVGYDRLDPTYEEAALVMGARPPAVFRFITLPLMMATIIAGATFSFLISFDEPVVALFFTRVDFITLPVRIFQYLRYNPDPTIAAIATITTLVSMILVVVADRLVGLGKLMGLRR
jgi:putative spermidine/putrescine transport system permease protein